MNESLGVTETEFVLVKSSNIHGTGCFARKDIPTGARIIEYVGEKITKAEATRQCELENGYIFDMDEDWDLNGNVPWNPARFINHSCEPNCDAEEEEGRIWIIAQRDIPAGTELTYNYGYDMEDFREFPCNCGTGTCVGYMVAEEYFDTVRRLRASMVNPCE